MSALDRLLDTGPLRSSPAFRRLWATSSLSLLGGQLTTVAVLYHVWQLTGSPVWVGLVGLAQAVPTVVVGLLGGALADAIERRRLVLVATAGQALAVTALALQTLAGWGDVRVVIALVSLLAACGALGSPARRTFVARLLPSRQVAAGVALTHLSFQVAILLGPALGGVVIARWGVAACYLLHVASFLAAAYGVVRLPTMAPAATSRPGVTALWAGMRFIRSSRVLSGAFATDLLATVMAMPVALFPMINEVRFEGAPETLGLFMAAVAVGGITAGALSGAVARARHLGRVMLGAAAVWGLALAGFGVVGTASLTFACLAIAGAADTVSVISRGALVQLVTPDDRRGRVTAVEQMVGVAGPDLGNLRAGLAADLTTATVATVAGGLLAAAGIGWVALTNRPLRRCVVHDS